MQMTLETLYPSIFPPPTYGAEVSLANLSAKLGEGSVLRILAELLSLKYSGLLPYKDPGYCSSKMLRVFLTTTAPARSAQYFPRWRNWGIMSNGNVLTARLMYPKAESGCLLSDIMEECPPDKYFLSPKSTARLFARLSAGHKAAESTTRSAQAPPSQAEAADSEANADYTLFQPPETT
jgi:hypothetical protein